MDVVVVLVVSVVFVVVVVDVVVGYSWKCFLHWPVHFIACQSLGTGSCIRPHENFKVGFSKHYF